MGKLLHREIFHAEQRKPSIRREPLLDEGKAAVTRQAPRAEVKPEMKPAEPAKEKKGLDARRYAAILSAVLMLPFIVSQASMLIGCVKSVVDATPVVTIESAKQADQLNSAPPVTSQKNSQSQKNVTAAPVMTQSQQQMNVTAAPMGASKPSDPNSNQTTVPGFYSNYTMP